MDIAVTLTDLSSMHPRLLWGEITCAAALILGNGQLETAIGFDLSAQNLPGFGTGAIQLNISDGDIPEARMAQLNRTYEHSRLVELAAIAIAGLGLYHGGGHEIRDVALRGTRADYLVDEAGHLLEIAGRSRRNDLEAAWQQRWQRLSEERFLRLCWRI